MGTWAVGPFGNDFALDWAQDLQESQDLFFIENTLDNVLTGAGEDDLEAPFAAEGLAAIEVLARLHGKPGEPEQGTQDIDAWVEQVRAKFRPRPDLVGKAQRAIGHILSERSELRALWQDSEHYAQWRAGVENLGARIGA